jgi:hypothetical protein
MKNFKIPINLIKSTGIVMFVSLLGGFSFYLIGYGFWSTFILFFIFQYILFSFFGNLINNYFLQKTKQKELEALEPLSTLLECAYCNKPNIMTFFPTDNEMLEMECASCQKKNSVRIQFVVARLTEPLTVPSVTGIPLVDNKK